MRSPTQARSRLLALGLLLTLSAGCEFTQAGDDVLYVCEPGGGCASEDQLCSRQNQCLPRSLALRILQPESFTQVNGPVVVEVALDAAAVDPQSLVLSVTKDDVSDSLTLNRVSEGRYRVQWRHSRGEGLYLLRASAPKEGLESGPVIVNVTTGPPNPNTEPEKPAPDGAASGCSAAAGSAGPAIAGLLALLVASIRRRGALLRV